MTQANETSNLKSRYFRIVLKQQNNRVEYRILSSSEENRYHPVQMHNGRAINCDCRAREFHQGVPCKHMDYANELERLHREREKVEQILEKMPDPVKEVAATELQRYLGVLASQVEQKVAQPKTKKEWQAVLRKQKANDRKANQEYRKSVERIKAAQMREVA